MFLFQGKICTNRDISSGVASAEAEADPVKDVRVEKRSDWPGGGGVVVVDIEIEGKLRGAEDCYHDEFPQKRLGLERRARFEKASCLVSGGEGERWDVGALKMRRRCKSLFEHGRQGCVDDEEGGKER